MKASIVVVLALLAFPMVARGAGEIRETPGTHVYQPRSNQTSSNTKVIETRSYANVSKAYIDGEGDLTCHDVTATGALAVTGNLTVGGTFTLPSSNFASGFTVNTDKWDVASTGNLNIGPDKFTITASSGNTAVVGTLTTTGVSALNGGITVDTSNFTVDGTTGAVSTASTLGVTGKSTLAAVDVSGTVAHTGAITGTSATDITINTSKFTVGASTGDVGVGRDIAVVRNGTVGGTLGVTGDFAVNTSALTCTASTGDVGVGRDLAVTRNETVGGTLTVTGAMTANGGLDMDGGAFSVANGTGNMICGGTATVTGLATLNGGLTMDSGAFQVADTSGNVSSTGTLTVSGAAALNGGIAVDSPAFTVADTSGNVATTGTLNVTGKSTLGAVDVSGTVAHTGAITGTSATDITINTDKFKVTGSSGATTVAGLLTATGGIAVNTSAFTVATSTGNVATTGTLTAGTAIAGATLIPIKGIMSYASASTNIAQLTTGTTTNTDFALTGVAVGDGCLVLSPPLVSAADSALVATCVAKTDNITLKLSNTTAGTLDPDDQVYTFMIIDRT